MHRYGLVCLQIFKGSDGFFRVHMRGFHKFTRVVSPDRDRRQIGGAQPFACLDEIICIACITGKIERIIRIDHPMTIMSGSGQMACVMTSDAPVAVNFTITITSSHQSSSSTFVIPAPCNRSFRPSGTRRLSVAVVCAKLSGWADQDDHNGCAKSNSINFWQFRQG